jgi:hypothetical protein
VDGRQQARDRVSHRFIDPSELLDGEFLKGLGDTLEGFDGPEL